MTAAIFLLAAALPAQSADPPQFTHSKWTSIDGVPGMISALAQTPDGYLWLGTYEGVFRFDGVSFERLPPATGHPLGAIPATAIFVTREGELWAGYAGKGGVEVYRHGRLIRAGMPDAPGEVTGFVEDHLGGLYVMGGREPNSLQRVWHGQWQHIDGRWGVPAEAVSSILPARDGTVWMATKTHLLFLRPGTTHFEDTGSKLTDGAGLAQDPQGDIWISGPEGTRMVADYPHGQSRPRNPVSYPAVEPVRRVTLLFDRSGALWGSTYVGGLFRIGAPGRDPGGEQSVQRFDITTGLTSNQAVAILQDRENNVWAATEIGLDQFRKADVEQAQLPPRTSSRGYKLAVDTSGVIYIGSGTALYRAGANEEPQPVRAVQDPSAMCSDPRGGIWLAMGDGITHVVGDRLVEFQRLKGSEPVTGCGVDPTGRLWMARPDSGVWVFDHQALSPFSLPAGTGRPKDVVIDRSGNPVIVTANRSVILIHRDHAPTVLAGDEIGVAGLTGVFPTDFGLLIAGGTGLALWDGHMLRRLSIDDHPWLRGIRGFVQTPRNELWMLNNKGIHRVGGLQLKQAFAHPRLPLDHLFLGEQDGLYSHSNGEDGLQGAVGTDGRIWFLTRQGPVRVDPNRLTSNRLAPTVLIRGLTSNGRHYPDPIRVNLAAGTRNLSIDYTALSLTVPSRVQFRYKLDGVDTEWVDPGARRQAFYTNLRPGSYRFTVTASNNNGVWSPQGTELQFVIPPTFIQSRLFIILCVAFTAMLLWFLYDLRVRTLAQRMRARVTERANERERIARELHDTLLQSIQALMLRFHVAAQAVQDEGTNEMLNEALDRAEEVLMEGRERVGSLRIADAGDDLEGAMSALIGRQEFPQEIRTNVVVRGKARPVCPTVVAEIERIAGEALFNSCRHAKAEHITVELIFRLSEVVICVKDDGVGIPAEVLNVGFRAGHYGLPGMRERARQLGADLVIRSTSAGGTEVRLAIPARVAFEDEGAPWWRSLLKRPSLAPG